MVNAADLKSADAKASCGFEPHPRHSRIIRELATATTTTGIRRAGRGYYLATSGAEFGWEPNQPGPRRQGGDSRHPDGAAVRPAGAAGPSPGVAVAPPGVAVAPGRGQWGPGVRGGGVDGRDDYRLD